MKPNSPQEPGIARLSRRQFMLLTGATAAALGTVGGVWLASRQKTSAPTGGERIKLPEEPSHNPAYQGRAIAENGAVVWTYESGSRFRGYRLNAAGRCVWRL